MKRSRVIHCDLKPENVLLCSKSSSWVKLIDFGTGCNEDEICFTYVQSRYYRAPEVILGMKYTCSIDMWSFGCLLLEFHVGYPVFAGEDECDQIAILMEYLGVPPKSMLMVSE
jgi:serine/threonine protein kinase